MQIRPVRPEECDALGLITVEAYRRLEGRTELGSYEDELRAVSARTTDCEVLVAVEGDVLLGGVTYVPNPDSTMSEFSDPDAAGVRMLAVHPCHQGAGVGRALMESCIASARAQNRRRIVLHSTPVMSIAQGLYRRLGFVPAPEMDVWFTDAPYSKDEPLHLIGYVLPLE